MAPGRSETDSVKRSSVWPRSLTGTQCISPAAILYNFDNESHANIEHATGQQRDASERAVYQALSERHLSADVRALSSLQRNGDLERLPNRLLPARSRFDSQRTSTPLNDYVEGGGTLVFGCWSGYRDRNHWCYDAPGKRFTKTLWASGLRISRWLRRVRPPPFPSRLSDGHR